MDRSFPYITRYKARARCPAERHTNSYFRCLFILNWSGWSPKRSPHPKMLYSEKCLFLVDSNSGRCFFQGEDWLEEICATAHGVVKLGCTGEEASYKEDSQMLRQWSHQNLGDLEMSAVGFFRYWSKCPPPHLILFFFFLSETFFLVQIGLGASM